ncbi:hypothetical protein EV192_113257 [Actinocrispum wychmicini]|uniref:Uncharacterized protein n=1 Tax=Actinocrispum wychmicini TaxID=1213861 RepID=A0A4R2J1W8_9PSEU|nr:hypothetical protein EV192_113257 [Actinocrispum wychmicini]
MSPQLADVIIHADEPTVVAAADLAIATLAELTGCVVVAVGVAGQGVLLAARPDQRMFVPTNDIVRVAVAAYVSLVDGGDLRSSRLATSAAFGSPLAEYVLMAVDQFDRASATSPRAQATSPSATSTPAT